MPDSCNQNMSVDWTVNGFLGRKGIGSCKCETVFQSHLGGKRREKEKYRTATFFLAFFEQVLKVNKHFTFF